MPDRRHARADSLDLIQVDVGESEPRLSPTVEQHLAPGIDHQRMPECRPPVLMPPDLRRGDDEGAGLNRTRAEEHMPMRFAGRKRRS